MLKQVLVIWILVIAIGNGKMNNKIKNLLLLFELLIYVIIGSVINLPNY